MSSDDPRLTTLAAELGISAELLAGRGLRPCLEAAQVELAETGADGREHLLVAAAARAWSELKAAAAGDGVELFIVSAFRSVERQADIVRRKLEAGVDIEAALRVCAAPGYSEHHSGRAVDVGTPGSPLLQEAFEQTAAYRWLSARAQEFGFQLSYPPGNAGGYDYEPWHWCYREETPLAAS